MKSDSCASGMHRWVAGTIIVVGLSHATPSAVASAARAEVLGDASFVAQDGQAGVVRLLKDLPGGGFRVDPPGTQGPAEASFALVRDFPVGDANANDLSLRPLFTRLADGRTRITIQAAPGTSLYGTGEVVLWNSDVPGYRPDAPSLYQSHPWVLGVRADGTAFGVLLDSTWRMTINLEDGIRFDHEGPAASLYLVERSSPEAVCTALKDLTGAMPLPPRWTLGYHQCRWSYFPESRVREVTAEFRKRRIPASVFWFDIDYMDGFRTFTFDKTRFADPTRLNADLESLGFKTVWMINPGIKDERGYFVRDQLVEQNLQVRNAAGETFLGGVWPGACVFPDFTSDRARQWWAGLYPPFMATGIDGVWNDMNEPAVFETPNKTMPEDNRHVGGTYRPFANSAPREVTAGNHSRFHNVYGMLMAQATFEGILAANPDKRPFVLTRASFLGGHRYAATWTGDNSATWTDLEQSIPMILNLGLSGQPFVGPDIGGFVGNGPSDEQERASQFARWMGIGAFFPFSRGHTAKGNINKEPWEFGADTERAVRIALQRRYILLPYLYTTFREAELTGVPVLRPTFFAAPTDRSLRSEDDTFLFGPSILVAPQLMPDGSRTVLLPTTDRGEWLKFDVQDESHPANPQMYLAPGAVVATGPVMQYESQRPLDELTLYVNLDRGGSASGLLYEDAGDGFGYRSGEYRLTRLTAERGPGGVVTLRMTQVEGNMAGTPERKVEVRVIGPGGVTSGLGTEGKGVAVPAGR
jgi:alpha-glucosidase